MIHGACAQSSNLLDELDHLIMFNGAFAFYVKLKEAEFKFVVAKVYVIRQLVKSFSDEYLGLVFVEEAIALFIVQTPDLLDTF